MMNEIIYNWMILMIGWQHLNEWIMTDDVQLLIYPVTVISFRIKLKLLWYFIFLLIKLLFYSFSVSYFNFSRMVNLHFSVHFSLNKT